MALDLAASARLMQMDDKINQIARNNASAINESINAPEVQMQAGGMQMQQPMGGTMGSAKSKLPREILESFSKNPPIQGSPTEAHSVLDQMNLDESQMASIRRNIQPQQSQRQTQQRTVIREQVSAGGVDYSLIKSIIDESVKKYVGAYTKKILTEQKNHTGGASGELNVMQIGENFKFVTKEGDLYEAKLVYKGNIKKKK